MVNPISCLRFKHWVEICKDIGHLCFKDILPVFKIIEHTALKTLSVQDYYKRNNSSKYQVIWNTLYIHRHNREHKRFLAQVKMTIFPKLTIRMSCKLICKNMFIFVIYCVGHMIFNMLFTKLYAKLGFMIKVMSIKIYCLEFNIWFKMVSI